jgi:hypothetical protein
MTNQIAVTITLGVDGDTNISLSETDRPVEVLRAAASVLERYAASIEREAQPFTCTTCSIVPTGVHARPGGEWRFEPCGHGFVTATS